MKGPCFYFHSARFNQSTCTPYGAARLSARRAARPAVAAHPSGHRSSVSLRSIAACGPRPLDLTAAAPKAQQLAPACRLEHDQIISRDRLLTRSAAAWSPGQAAAAELARFGTTAPPWLLLPSLLHSPVLQRDVQHLPLDGRWFALPRAHRAVCEDEPDTVVRWCARPADLSAMIITGRPSQHGHDRR